MRNVQGLSHSKWECVYCITWIPKCRKKKSYEELWEYLSQVFKELRADLSLAGRASALRLRDLVPAYAVSDTATDWD